MPEPRFEIPAGAIDGANVTFVTSQPYRPGSTAVFLNGQLKTQALDDGWDETDPAGGVVTLNEAPRGSPGDPDVVQIFYIDTSPVLPETVVDTRLVGVLREVDTLEAEIVSTGLLGGLVDDSGLGLEGAISEVDQLGGVVQDVEALSGKIIGVC
jgi:microcompartment protein CcmL/EutN